MSNKKSKTTKKTTKKNNKSSSKKNSLKKSPPKNVLPVLSKETYRGLYFVISVLIVILSVLQMGFIGRFFDAFFKYILGNFSYILYLIIVATPIYYIMNKKVKSPIILSTLLILIDFLFQLIFIRNKNNYVTFNDIYSGKVSELGGGLISYYPVKFLIYLLSYYGSLLVIISALITVIFLYFNINHRVFILKVKYYIVNAFDKNEHTEDSLNYYEDEDLFYDEHIDNESKKENSNEQRYNNIKDKDLVVDIREFKEDEIINEEEVVKIPSRKQKKANQADVHTPKDSINELVTEESYDNYQLPPVTLLNNPVKKQTITKGDVVEKSKILQSTFNRLRL